MARPDLDVVGEAEEATARVEEADGAAAGKVAAGGADVGVEEGVAAEDVVYGMSVRCYEGLFYLVPPIL